MQGRRFPEEQGIEAEIKKLRREIFEILELKQMENHNWIWHIFEEIKKDFFLYGGMDEANLARTGFGWGEDEKL